jgi:DNA polymerase-3 subunit beta
MKFVISTQELNFLLNKCLNVVGSKSTIPILSNLLIEASNDELIITATDLTVGVRCFAEAKILEEGATTLPAKRLAQLVRELTTMHLEIQTNPNDVTEIITGSSRFKLHGMSRGEFPTLPNMSGAVHCEIPQAELKEMLFRTAFAVSRDDNRYVLTGAYLQVVNGEATCIGTDGKRLARARMPIPIDPAFSGNYIIPLKAVEEILKNLGEEGLAKISFLSDKIAVEANNTIIVTKLLSGDYPDISRVIPERSEKVVSLHREELTTLLRQISLFAAETSHSVRFSFIDGELMLNANAMDVGEGKVSMPVNYQGENLEVAFNPNFFLDILRHTKGDTVMMGLTDAFNPGVITDASIVSNPATARSLFILMPMRLNEQ